MPTSALMQILRIRRNPVKIGSFYRRADEGIGPYSLAIASFLHNFLSLRAGDHTDVAIPRIFSFYSRDTTSRKYRSTSRSSVTSVMPFFRSNPKFCFSMAMYSHPERDEVCSVNCSEEPKVGARS